MLSKNYAETICASLLFVVDDLSNKNSIFMNIYWHSSKL